MTVEAAGFIDDIDPTLPLGTDAKSEGDDHLRNLKKSVQDSFPNITGAMTATHIELNQLAGTVGAVFPTGTLMLFQQTAAPTGWTKQATHNDKALRVVSGSVVNGGSVAFSTVFGKAATDSHTLSTGEMPSHTHDERAQNNAAAYTANGAGGNTSVSGGTGLSGASRQATDATGGGGGHTHGMDIRVQYVDLIIASKD